MDKRQLLNFIGRSGISAPDVFRYERKYVISEAAADAVRQFVAPYLTPDAHMKPNERRGYQVFSLYLDTHFFSMYRQTVEGVRSRYKLRIRFYDTLEDGLALFEIKSRSADSIHKQRAAVSKSAAAMFLRGLPVSSAELVSGSDKSIRALAEFCERRDRLNAVPTAFVSYWREAYVSSQPEEIRVTMDRDLEARDGRFAQSLDLPNESVPATPNKVVLELKNSGRTPAWMRDLIRTFNLQRVSFPKYVYCVDALQLAAPPSQKPERVSCR
ncbi:MAG TPA: polyphosphate polymerase domain-containing protein [Lacipirellula sp.]